MTTGKVAPKVAIVTAGGSGMGAAARRLAADGFRVAIPSSSGNGADAGSPFAESRRIVETAQGARPSKITPEQMREFLEKTLGVPKDVPVMLDDNAGAAVAAMMMRQGIKPPDDAVFRPGSGPAEITLMSADGKVGGRISFSMDGAETMDEINAWLDRMADGSGR